MSLTRQLISYIRNKPVTEADLAAAALFTLDAVATAYAGCNTEVGQKLRAWARSGELDNKRRALLMAALTHITETDDLHRASVTHPGCVVVPAALCLAEQTGASAEQTLTAILQGFEAMCRIGAAVGPLHYKVWHNTATCGPFGSAMAAACLLDLDLDQTVDALGNAGTQSSGFWQFIETGAMSKHLHAGRACESGMLAAELAAQGFTGSPQILEGEKGFFVAMCPDPVPEAVLANPESRWQLPLTSIKPWPSCRHTHPAIDCALELHAELKGATIQSVSLDTYQAALDICDRPEPDNEYQAKFSLYHCVAIALQDGEVNLGSFTPAARERSAAIRRVTTAQAVAPYAARYPIHWGSALQVTTNDGNTLIAQRKDCKGDPELPLSETEMRVKATGLLNHGGLDSVRAKALCDSILGLPNNDAGLTLFRDFLAHQAHPQ